MNKYKGCNIKYENITIQEVLDFYAIGIYCNCDADAKEVYFIQEVKYDRSKGSIKTNR